MLRIPFLLVSTLWWTVVTASRYRDLYGEEDDMEEENVVETGRYVF